MMGSFVTSGLVMVFGYAYPAYECFKTVEKNKPEIEHLRFWCQYWILVALLTVFERLGDAFVSWLPMYCEAKLAFFIYLWCPNTKGTTYVYHSFFRPYLAKHEPDIDRNLSELKTRAGDLALLYCQRAATYGQTRIYDILHYVASQSTLTSQQGSGSCNPPSTVRTKPSDATSQPPQQPPQLPQEKPSRSSSLASTQKQQALPPSRSASTGSTQQQQPPSRTSSTGITNQQQEKTLDKISPVVPTAVTAVQIEAKSATQLSQPSETDTEAMQSEEQSSRDPPPQDTVMEEVIRVTRGRLRKNRSVGKS